VAILSFRPFAQWILGYPETALAEAGRPFNAAREMEHAPTLIFALACTTFTHIFCREYAIANAQLEECIALAEEKGAPMMKMLATSERGSVLALTGEAFGAVETISAGLNGYRSTGATAWTTAWLSHLALANAQLRKFDDAWGCISEAISVAETTKERWFEAEINRIAGEIALMAPQQDAAKAQEYYERALKVARQQQARSWELRAAMSMARLRRDQGKSQQAWELLAPVYGWFTEGFDTLDLKEAKALLAELA
jgi:predicted ATPase